MTYVILSAEHCTDTLPGTYTGSLRRRARHAGPLALRSAFCLCCLAALAVHTPVCLADTTADAADNQTLQITFLSLKPGNTIGPSRLRLRADGTLTFSIAGETLSSLRGTWTRQDRRFSATVDFILDRQPGFHYRLVLDGYTLMDLYAGHARLREHDRHDSLVQEIIFVFYAADSSGTRGPGRTDRDTIQ